VTCHVGVPSCGQRHRNVFIDLLLTCTITNTIINDSLASPPCALSPALFLLPTLPLLYYLSPCVLFPLKPNPVDEDWWKGFIRPVHRPSPRGAVDVKSTTPTHPVDYRVNTLVFTCDGANIRKIDSDDIQYSYNFAHAFLHLTVEQSGDTHTCFARPFEPKSTITLRRFRLGAAAPPECEVCLTDEPKYSSIS